MSLTVMRDGSEQIHYGNPGLPIYVSRGDLKAFPNMAALCHWHEDVELLMPVKGHLSYFVDGTQITIQEGDAIFVNARHMHYGFSVDGTDCDYVCLTFRPEMLCVNDEIRSRYILPVLTNPHLSHYVIHHDEHSHRLALDAIQQIGWIYEKAAPGFELQMISCLFRFWQVLYSILEERIGAVCFSDPLVLIQRQMLEYIRTHYRERITLDEIAASGGVCRTKCCQVFRKYLGRTPNDYLNSFRLEKGMEMLKSTDMTITEIAGACGFSSASYFTEMFTRQKGCTPKTYRNMIN